MGGHELLAAGWIAAGQEYRERRQGEVPPDADRPGTVLRPLLVIGNGMAQNQLRRLVASIRELQLNVAGRQVAKFPGHPQRTRRLAHKNRASRIALELEAATVPQVTAQRQNQR